MKEEQEAKSALPVADRLEENPNYFKLLNDVNQLGCLVLSDRIKVDMDWTITGETKDMKLNDVELQNNYIEIGIRHKDTGVDYLAVARIDLTDMDMSQVMNYQNIIQYFDPKRRNVVILNLMNYLGQLQIVLNDYMTPMLEVLPQGGKVDFEERMRDMVDRMPDLTCSNLVPNLDEACTEMAGLVKKLSENKVEVDLEKAEELAQKATIVYKDVSYYHYGEKGDIQLWMNDKSTEYVITNKGEIVCLMGVQDTIGKPYISVGMK